MQLTPKLREALRIAAAAPGHTMTRCCKGFRPARSFGPVAITRRTANSLVNACLADYDDRTLPSALTLTPRGVEVAKASA